MESLYSWGRDKHSNDSNSRKMFPELPKSIPIHRWGTVEDIASIMAYLASDEASYITGQAIVVDGGWTLTRAGIPTL